MSARPPPSRVGNALLQKRQSVHYAYQKPSFDAAAPLPSRTHDTAAAGAPSRPPADSSSSSSLAPFTSENFDAGQFVDTRLSRSTPASQLEDLRALKDELNNLLQLNSTGLQKSVLHNYAEFVKISKDVSTLESDLVDIKGALEEWKSVPASLEIVPDEASSSSTPANRRAHRNSIADVAALYRQQLEALWDTVEGSQKFLPPVPNRHIIAETSRFIQIDSATYKPRRAVHLVLLNDSLLIAVKKRRQMGAKERLVADRCFVLNEIVVVDLKDSPALTNAIKVKRGRESLIFRSEKAEDKKTLLVSFKKIAEETLKKKRTENAVEAESQWKSIRVEGLPDDSGIPRYEPNPSPWVQPCKALGLKRKDDPSGRDISWIDDLSCELSVHIATREFETAVAFIEKGRLLAEEMAASPFSSSLLASTLNAHAENLVTTLLATLSASWCSKATLVEYASLLLRLNQGEAAREAFLSGRRIVLDQRANTIVLQDDLPEYINELTQVTFTGIKNTCEWYMAGFKDATMASGFVRWASEQMESFTITFREKVWSAGPPDQIDPLVIECWEKAKKHFQVLRDVGLDFGFVLSALLVPPGAEPVPNVETFQQQEEQIHQQLEKHQQPIALGEPDSSEFIMSL